jgi:hypothetical protein
MALEFELVRGNDCLHCDWFVWWDTTELARAYGWKPRTPNLRRSLVESPKYPNHTEVADEDAQSLAMAITECVRILSANKRPTRRQMSGLIRFTAIEGNSFVVFLEEPARIANFCRNGGFRLTLKRQTGICA